MGTITDGKEKYKKIKNEKHKLEEVFKNRDWETMENEASSDFIAKKFADHDSPSSIIDSFVRAASPTQERLENIFENMVMYLRTRDAEAAIECVAKHLKRVTNGDTLSLLGNYMEKQVKENNQTGDDLFNKIGVVSIAFEANDKNKDDIHRGLARIITHPSLIPYVKRLLQDEKTTADAKDAIAASGVANRIPSVVRTYLKHYPHNGKEQIRSLTLKAANNNALTVLDELIAEVDAEYIVDCLFELGVNKSEIVLLMERYNININEPESFYEQIESIDELKFLFYTMGLPIEAAGPAYEYAKNNDKQKMIEWFKQNVSKNKRALLEV